MVKSSSHNITIIGSGYVGMSLATLLSQYHKVTIVDIDKEKVKKINAGMSPVKDSMISDYLKHKDLNLRASSSLSGIIKLADIAIIATPTDYDDETGQFDTSSVDKIVEEILHHNSKVVIVIKAQNHRTQERNKQEAFDRLQLLLQKALNRKKYRRPSTPSYGSIKRRLKKKSERKEIKKLRKKVKDFD